MYSYGFSPYIQEQYIILKKSKYLILLLTNKEVFVYYSLTSKYLLSASISTPAPKRITSVAGKPVSSSACFKASWACCSLKPKVTRERPTTLQGRSGRTQLTVSSLIAIMR